MILIIYSALSEEILLSSFLFFIYFLDVSMCLDSLQVSFLIFKKALVTQITVWDLSDIMVSINFFLFQSELS